MKKVIFMAKNAKEKRILMAYDSYKDIIRKNVGAYIPRENFLSAKCWDGKYHFVTDNAIKALNALKRINPEDEVYLVAVTWDRTPGDWLDSEVPEPTTGKIDTERKTEYYTPFSSTAHLMSRGEIKTSKENTLKDLQIVLENRATVLWMHEAVIYNMKEEVGKLKDAYKANPTLSWKGIPASEMWELTTEIGNSADASKARDLIFAAGAHPILWDDDIIIHVHEGCNHPIRWKEVNDVPYDRGEDAEEQEYDVFHYIEDNDVAQEENIFDYNEDGIYTEYYNIPLFECPYCGEVLTRKDYLKGKEAAKKAIEEAYIIYEEYRKNELEAERARKEAAEKAAALKEATAKKQLAIATRDNK